VAQPAGVERDIEHARLMAGLYEIAHEVTLDTRFGELRYREGQRRR
jgi:hypothetical protein